MHIGKEKQRKMNARKRKGRSREEKTGDLKNNQWTFLQFYIDYIFSKNCHVLHKIINLLAKNRVLRQYLPKVKKTDFA